MQALSPDMSAAAVRVLALTIMRLFFMALIPRMAAKMANGAVSEATLYIHYRPSTILCLRLWKHTRRETMFPKEFYCTTSKIDTTSLWL
jgi:hypothetical protein